MVESVYDSGVEETAYNCRVADYHTYFVSGKAWDFSVWAHNKCAGLHHFVPRALGSTVPYGHKFLTWLNAVDHTAIHTGMSAFLRTKTKVIAGKVVTMLPGPGNPGPKIIRNFTRTERLKALVEFHKSFMGGAYYQTFLTELRKSFKAGKII